MTTHSTDPAYRRFLFLWHWALGVHYDVYIAHREGIGADQVGR